MVKMTLPSGVSKVSTNGNYTAKEGDTVDVTPYQARQIVERTSAPGRRAVRSRAQSVGTRQGKRCPECRFLAQAWSLECPRCSTPTVDEVT
jgi:hypothetical protein